MPGPYEVIKFHGKEIFLHGVLFGNAPPGGGKNRRPVFEKSWCNSVTVNFGGYIACRQGGVANGRELAPGRGKVSKAEVRLEQIVETGSGYLGLGRCRNFLLGRGKKAARGRWRAQKM